MTDMKLSFRRQGIVDIGGPSLALLMGKAAGAWCITASEYVVGG